MLENLIIRFYTNLKFMSSTLIKAQNTTVFTSGRSDPTVHAITKQQRKWGSLCWPGSWRSASGESSWTCQLPQGHGVWVPIRMIGTGIWVPLYPANNTHATLTMATLVWGDWLWALWDEVGHMGRSQRACEAPHYWYSLKHYALNPKPKVLHTCSLPQWKII